MKTVKLTVVIPHWNYGRYLRECLESLEAQTFCDYETILVDGESTDNTFEVLKDFPDVKVVVDPQPSNPVKAVNKAIPIMRGEYFTQLNSDCVLHPTIYEQCIDVLESNRELGMVYTSWLIINDSGHVIGRARQPAEFNRDLLLQGNFIDATSMVIRKQCFDVVGVFDLRCPWSMDWVMAVKIASVFPVAFLNKALFHYRVHKGQITESRSKIEKNHVLKIIRGYYGVAAKLKADVRSLARGVLK